VLLRSDTEHKESLFLIQVTVRTGEYLRIASMYSNQDSAPKPQPKGAKHGIDVRAGTKARQTLGVTIRQKNRVEALTKRRRAGAPEDEQHTHIDPNQAPAAIAANSHYDEDEPFEEYVMNEDRGSDDPWSYNSKTIPELVPMRLLPVFADMARSDNPQAVYHGVLMIRKILSVNENVPIDAICETGILPALVEMLSRDDWAELQFEAAWAVSNIASGTAYHTRMIINLGAVPHFVRLLGSAQEEVREQAAWALGNIAGDNYDSRNIILSYGAMPALLSAIEMPIRKPTTLRNEVWALSNLCRSKPAPPLDAVQIALPTLASLLYHPDVEVQADACWAISYISEGGTDRVEVVLNTSGLLDRVAELLGAPNTALQAPALRTIGNGVAGIEQHTSKVTESAALRNMLRALMSTKRAIRKEACWALSNIAAGPDYHIQSIIDADLFPTLIKIIDAVAEYEVKKEALWCLANATSGGTAAQIRYLVGLGAIVALERMLQSHDSNIVTVALEAIENILNVGADEMTANNLERNPYGEILFDCEGVEALEICQEHTNDAISSHASAILQNYFPTDPVSYGPSSASNSSPVHGNYNFASFGALNRPGGDIEYDFSSTR
jgi:importin subunit alpha-1